MPQIEANGLHIEYDTFGDSEAEPLLLIMGLGTQMTAWTPEFCNSLADHGHYVIRFDNRDVGLSTKFDRVRAPSLMSYAVSRFFGTTLRPPYSLSDMASDAVGLLDALNIDTAHIVGASMGGMIAQLVTVEHPNRVKSLTSVMSSSGDPKLPRTHPEVMKHIFFRRPRTSNQDRIIQYTVNTMKLISSPSYPRTDEYWREMVTASMKRSYYPQGFLRHVAAIVGDGSRVRRLQTIDTPALVIHGTADALVPVECGIDTANHIPNARLELIEGMGHDLPPQLAAKLAAMIADHTQQYAQQVS